MEFENCIEEQRENDEDVGTEEELIELVKACPILYDVRLKVYKDRNMKESAWRSISEAMKLSGKYFLLSKLFLIFQAYFAICWPSNDSLKLICR